MHMLRSACKLRTRQTSSLTFHLLPPTSLLYNSLFSVRVRGMHRYCSCIFVNDVRPKRRKNNQVQRIVKRPAGVEREGRSEAEERPNEARRAARRGEIIAR